jgi:hypothetical protein
VTAIAAGGSHSLALKDDGTIWAWGNNSDGQIGDGSFNIRNRAVQVSGFGGTDVTAIAAGGSHSLALRSDGTVWAWGYNSDGQLGDGTTVRSNTPVRVMTGSSTELTNVTAIAAGGSHSLALRNDMSIWAWGYNSNGQLGIGSTAASNRPLVSASYPIPGSNGAITISDLSHDSLTLNWAKAADDITAQFGLKYYVYMNSAAFTMAYGLPTNGTLMNTGGTPDMSTYNVTGLSQLTTYHFIVVVENGTYNKTSYKSVTGTTAAAPLSGTATIDNGSPKIGDILTGTLTGGNNSGTLTYQWKADGTEAGTGMTYTVAVGDLDKVITLEITSSVQTGTRTSAATSAVVKKDAPLARVAPDLQSRTNNTVTLEPLTGDEYSIDGTNWQPSNVFTGLSSGTSYTFYQRVAGTDDTLPSAPSSGLNVTTGYGVTVNGGMPSHQHGDAGIEVTLTPDGAPKGQQFKGWNVISGNVTVNDGKFILGSADVEIEAEWEDAPDSNILLIAVAVIAILAIIAIAYLIFVRRP